MGSAIPSLRCWAMPGIAILPTTRGPYYAGSGEAVQRLRLPTDSIGTATVKFTGVAPNSEVRIYLPNATEVAGVENCVADQVLTWPAYAAGSANNTVRVLVMHNAYKLKEFNFTVAVGAQTLPIQQDRDPWYSNP